LIAQIVRGWLSLNLNLNSKVDPRRSATDIGSSLKGSSRWREGGEAQVGEEAFSTAGFCDKYSSFPEKRHEIETSKS
jgi:hypothetical protein